MALQLRNGGGKFRNQKNNNDSMYSSLGIEETPEMKEARLKREEAAKAAKEALAQKQEEQRLRALAFEQRDAAKRQREEQKREEEEIRNNPELAAERERRLAEQKELELQRERFKAEEQAKIDAEKRVKEKSMDQTEALIASIRAQVQKEKAAKDEPVGNKGGVKVSSDAAKAKNEPPKQQFRTISPEEMAKLEEKKKMKAEGIEPEKERAPLGGVQNGPTLGGLQKDEPTLGNPTAGQGGLGSIGSGGGLGIQIDTPTMQTGADESTIALNVDAINKAVQDSEKKEDAPASTLQSRPSVPVPEPVQVVGTSDTIIVDDGKGDWGEADEGDEISWVESDVKPQSVSENVRKPESLMDANGDIISVVPVRQRPVGANDVKSAYNIDFDDDDDDIPIVRSSDIDDETRERAKAEAIRQAAEAAKIRDEEEAKRKAEEDARNKALDEAREKARLEELAKFQAAERERLQNDEEARRQAEEAKRQAEEARMKAEEEARAKAEEEARIKAEEEAKRKAEEEAARIQAEEARRKAEEEEARRRAEEEETRRKAEEEEARRRAEEEEARRRAEEEARRKAEEEEARRRAEEEARRKAEEEEARRKAEEEARRKAEEEETRRKAEEEARRKAEEEEARRRAEEEARRKAEEEEARRKAEEEARRKAEEEEARRKAEEEARRKAEEEEARRKAEEEARRKAEEEARRKAEEEEARRKAEEEARAKAEEEARRKAEEEARAKAEEEARRKAEEEARAKAEEEARRKAEEEARAKAEEEARRKAEEEAKRKAEEEAKAKAAASASGQYALPVGAEQFLGKYLTVSAISDQIVKTIKTIAENPSEPRNIVILGQYGFGTTAIAEDFARSFYAMGICKTKTIAKIKGGALNRANIGDAIGKLQGGCLVVENAGIITNEKLNEIYQLVNNPNNDVVVILTGQIETLSKIFKDNVVISSQFKHLVQVHRITDLDVLAIAKNHAEKSGYPCEANAEQMLRRRMQEVESGNLDRVLKVVDNAISKAHNREMASGDQEHRLTGVDFE